MKKIARTVLLGGVMTLHSAASHAVELKGTIVDADTGQILAARVYIQGSDGRWWFCESADPEGNAVPYREQWVPMEHAVDRHTTVSAHPFRATLEPGEYEVTVERGKEYFPLTRRIRLGATNQQVVFPIQRWINMAERGWYSGETHVHRRLQELPNVMRAEQLNVAFPVTFWTTEAYARPGRDPSPLRRQGPSPFGPREDRGAAVIEVDSEHVIFPRNTEYEIFSVDGRSHVLGALFILNHQSIFLQGVPPVAEVAQQAHREGALLDLDKHNWPWSMMLVPIAHVDLFELSNNSLWRTQFGFRQTTIEPAAYMRVEQDAEGLTESGWIRFGFEAYYTLLNCGFRLRPTAGTASGVHPVPLGFSRVYVNVDPFTADGWWQGLRQGRSFVTTGPMLFVTIDGQGPGEVWQQNTPGRQYDVEIEALSPLPLERIEIVQHGRVVQVAQPAQEGNFERLPQGASRTRWTTKLTIDQTSWAAVRAFERQADGRIRFAHTGPWHMEVAGQPIRPRRAEVDYLIELMTREIQRNRDVLSAESLQEFEQALHVYRQLAERAR